MQQRPPLQQLLAASALIVTCEKIVASGRLPETDEQNLRQLIARCCRAYQIPTVAERASTVANDTDFDAQLVLVASALNVLPNGAA